MSADAQPRVQRAPELNFDLFYRENIESVRWFLRLRCSSAEVAEEAAQEAFFMAYLRWSEVSQHARPVAWVYTTGEYKLMEARRKERSQHRVGLDEVGLGPSGLNPHALTDTTRVLVQLMSYLDPDERQALFLYGFGWSDKEGASIMNVTLSTFKNFKRNGIRKLRKYGERAGLGDGGAS